jgi:hypothetical protein
LMSSVVECSFSWCWAFTFMLSNGWFFIDIFSCSPSLNP